VTLSTGCTYDAEDCPLDGLLADTRVVLSLKPADEGCPWPLQYATIPGTFDLEVCETMTPADALTCGYAYHFECPGPIVDRVGTRLRVEIDGFLELENWRDGVTGAAWLTMRHPVDRHVVCEGDYSASAWAVE
jgi:hypothetical protein